MMEKIFMGMYIWLHLGCVIMLMGLIVDRYTCKNKGETEFGYNEIQRAISAIFGIMGWPVVLVWYLGVKLTVVDND